MAAQAAVLRSANQGEKRNDLREPHSVLSDSNQEPSALDDPEKMLAMMKQSANELGEILTKLCAEEASDSTDDETYSIDDEEDGSARLQGRNNLSAEEFFTEVRDGFKRKTTVTFPLDEDNNSEQLQAETHQSHDAFTNVSFIFHEPATPKTTANFDQVESATWSLPESLTISSSASRIARFLCEIDSTLPHEAANKLAQCESAGLQQLLSSDFEKVAVQQLFPTELLAPNVQIEWQHGTRICKAQAMERRRGRQWGLQLHYTIESIVRARVLAPAVAENGSSANLHHGPPIFSTLHRRGFIPKTAYASLTNGEPTFDHHMRLELSLAPAKETKERETIATSAILAADKRQLPEFVDVYHCGRFSTSAAPDHHTDTQQAQSAAAIHFDKLSITTPLPRNRIVQAACARSHTLLLNDAGLVFSFGYAIDGALGHGDRLGRIEFHVPQPRLIDYFFDNGLTVRSVACGGDDVTGFHSAAVTRDGRVFTWGIGTALGVGSIKNQSTPSAVSFPTVGSDEEAAKPPPRIESIACGSGFCVAVDGAGTAYSWGKWSDGRLGLGAIPVVHKTSRQQGSRRQLQRFQLVPRAIPSTCGWLKIDCGDAHCLGISTDGRLFAWGRGTHGQLGTGDVRDAMAPVQLFATASNLHHSEWKDVAAGQDWSLAVDAHGAVWSWGAFALLGLSPPTATAVHNATLAELLLLKHRQLQQQTLSSGDRLLPPTARPPRFDWLRPRRIPTLALGGDVAIRSVSAGSRHAAAVSERGDLFLWGAPSLGLPPTPTLVTPSPSASIVERVFCGGDHVMLLASGSFLAHATQQLHRSQPPLCPPDTLLVVAGGHALPAHKLILGQRSPVLRELLPNEELGRSSIATTELLLPQLREDVAKVVLEFIYSDNLSTALDPLAYLVRDVQRAAQQLRIPRLVSLCCQRLAALDPLLVEEAEEAVEEEEGELGHSLPHDLALAVGDATWADLVIVAENRRLPVHRCLLVARSEYFRALLAFPSSSSSTTVELAVEESFLGMRRVLQFIYSDSLATLDSDDSEEEDRTDQLLEDLIAADKFGLVRMKQLCEHHVAVAAANCVDVLVVADLVHAEQLKQRALSFIESHLDLLSATPVLLRLRAEFPHLLHELYDAIQRHAQQQSLLKEWRGTVEAAVRRQQQDQEQQWQATTDKTAFPWVPLILALVFATLYLTVMRAQESDYPLVPMVNIAVVGGLLAAALLGKV